MVGTKWLLSKVYLPPGDAPQLLRMATELKGVTSLSKPFRLAELLDEVRARFAALPQQAPKPAA